MADVVEGTIALSIGSQRISMATFEPARGGGLILKSYGSSNILADPAQEMARLPQISMALTELSGKLKIQKERVRYAMSGQAVFMRFVKLPALDEDNIDQLVAFEAQQHVPFPIDEVVWDWQLLESSGSEREVALVAIKGDALTEINNTVGEAGLGTKEVDAAPMALYNAFRYNYPEEQESVLLMDIGAKATNLVYIEGARMFARSIAVGAASITTAIAKEYHISFAEAETQKITNGLVSLGGGHTDQLDEATANLATTIRNALNRLPAEVSRTNNYYRSQHEGNPPTKVYLGGGGANLPYLPEFLEEKLRLPIEIFNPLKRISVGKAVDVEQLGLEAHMFGELVGLALRGIGEATVSIDLVPDTVASERATAKRKPFLMAAAVILLAGVSAWAVQKMSMAGTARKKVEAIQKVNAGYEPIAKDIDKLATSQKALENLGNSFSDVQASRTRWVGILNKVKDYFASDKVWITDLEPIAKYKIGDFRGAETVIKDNFATVAYGTSSMSKIRVSGSGASPGQGKKNQPPAKPMINAIRISGYWRDNPKGPRAVNDILERIVKDESSENPFKLVKAPANPKADPEPLKDKDIFPPGGLKGAIDDPNHLAAPFTMVLPLAKPMPIPQTQN